MNMIAIATALALTATATLTYANRAGRAEAALRRIVSAQAAAMEANETASQAAYERLANDRDDAIDAASEMLPVAR